MFGIKDSDNLNNNIQLDDIVNGNGEWKHLQPVIRTTFRVLFEVINTQQEQIMAMNDHMKDIRRSVAIKPDVEDISQLIKSRDIANSTMMGQGGGTVASRMNPVHLSEDIKLCNSNIIQLKAELERKASMRYVDDTLRRKADKTVVDQLVIKTNHSNTQMTLQQSIHKCNLSIEALQDDFQELRSKSYLTDKTIQDAHNKLQYVANVQDVTAVRDECLRRCDEGISKQAVEKLLEKKVNQTQFNEEMTKKADLGLVNAQGGELGDTVANHEQVLTILQMKLQELSAYYGTTSASAVAPGGGVGGGLDDLFASTLSSFAPAGLHSPGFIPSTAGPQPSVSNSATPIRNKPWRGTTTTPVTGGRHGATTPAPAPPANANLANLRNVTAAVQQGREIGLITGLVDKLDNLHATLTHMTTDVRVNGDRISGVEHQLNNYTINTDQYKALEQQVHQCSKTVTDVVSGQQCIIPVEAILVDHGARVEAIERYVGGPLAQRSAGRRHQSRAHASSGTHGYSTSDFIPTTPTMTSPNFRAEMSANSNNGNSISGHNQQSAYSRSSPGAEAIASSGYGGMDPSSGPESNNLSASVEDVHNLLELLGAKIKEHSVILNKVLLHVDQFESYNKSMDDRLMLLEEVNSSVVTPLRQFCDLTGNDSYRNSTNSSSGVDVSSIKDVVSSLGDLNKQIRVLRHEQEECVLKLTSVGNEQGRIRDVVESAQLDSKVFAGSYQQLTSKVAELDKMQAKIIAKLKRFPGEVINTVEKRFTETLLVASQTGGGLGADTLQFSSAGGGGRSMHSTAPASARESSPERPEFHDFVHSVQPSSHPVESHPHHSSSRGQGLSRHQQVVPPVPPSHSRKCHSISSHGHKEKHRSQSPEERHSSHPSHGHGHGHSSSDHGHKEKHRSRSPEERHSSHPSHGHGHSSNDHGHKEKHRSHSMEERHSSLMHEHAWRQQQAREQEGRASDRHAAEKHAHVPEDHHTHYVAHMNDHNVQHTKHGHGRGHRHTHRHTGSQFRHEHRQPESHASTGIVSSSAATKTVAARSDAAHHEEQERGQKQRSSSVSSLDSAVEPETHTLDYIDLRLRELQLEKQKMKSSRRARGRTKSSSSAATDGTGDDLLAGAGDALSVDMLSLSTADVLEAATSSYSGAAAATTTTGDGHLDSESDYLSGDADSL